MLNVKDNYSNYKRDDWRKRFCGYCGSSANCSEMELMLHIDQCEKNAARKK